LSGGFIYKPTISTSFSANAGSLDSSLKLLIGPHISRRPGILRPMLLDSILRKAQKGNSEGQIDGWWVGRWMVGS
jgi:hypothetical protein